MATQHRRTLIECRELLLTLAWKTIALRYKQAYLGILWAVIKPVALVLIFSLVRSFVGIDSGDTPYPVLTFAALMLWIFFQEAASDGVNSIVGNVHLIRKIYFPREIFPISSVVTKLVELGINVVIVIGMMLAYGIPVTSMVLWAPVLILYTVAVALMIAFIGSALNVYYRDVGNALPVVLSLMMYCSPVIYPLALVEKKLIQEGAAGEWSDLLYGLYLANPLAGLIDSFQNIMLRGLPPDFSALLPGILITLVGLPLSYSYFKRAERDFADII
ncbi:ABC transporter permease [Methyloversatilis discipulorum]|uniref:ABC transporter permease n=1 Tax=Methyloversatilis discipulorum TaxID=1119528 RepID=UPI003AF9903C